jgi:hypothetical protein
MTGQYQMYSNTAVTARSAATRQSMDRFLRRDDGAAADAPQHRRHCEERSDVAVHFYCRVVIVGSQRLPALQTTHPQSTMGRINTRRAWSARVVFNPRRR